MGSTGVFSKKYVNRYQLQFVKGVWNAETKKWTTASSKSARNFYHCTQSGHETDELAKYITDNPGKWAAVKWWNNKWTGKSGEGDTGWQYGDEKRKPLVESGKVNPFAGAREYHDVYHYEYGDDGMC